MIRNQKYSVLTFVPIVLFQQFRFFFNMYFLLVALSQLVPVLRIGTAGTWRGRGRSRRYGGAVKGVE